MTERARPLAERPLGGSDNGFVMVEWTDRGESDAERPIAPIHAHHGGEEAWCVLEGTLGVRLGDEVHTVEAGCAVMAEKGTPHTFWNAGDEPCRYVVVMTPEIHELIRSLHEPGLSRDRSTMEALFSAHQSQLF